MTASGLDRQFARTPYAVSFAADRIQLTLVTLHVLYGEEAARAGELREIAAWLARWAEEERHWNQNLIALGDFNIDRRGDPLFDAFTSSGIEPAPQLNDVPRTIFGDPGREQVLRPDRLVHDEERGPDAHAPGLGRRAGSTSCRCSRAASRRSGALVEGLRPLPLWVEFSVR